MYVIFAFAKCWSVHSTGVSRGVASVNARHAMHACFQWIELGPFKTLNEVLNYKHKEK